MLIKIIFQTIRCISTNSRLRNQDTLQVNKKTNNEEILPVNKFTHRSHTCGELGVQNIGENVHMFGWMEFQRMNKFITLRDAYGSTQLVIPDNVSYQAKN